MFSLKQAARLIPHAQVIGKADVVFHRVSIDSRSVQPGDLFVALKGERFDAHDFLAEAAARGAVAMLVSRRLMASPTCSMVQVSDTRIALGALACGWRQQFVLPLVAVAGSNGKTTVKGMIASIFAAAVGKTASFATHGNFNNDIGLPLTLLRLNAAHRLAVVEFGMNHPGETTILANIAQPTIALINNAQREHQEFMATVEAVALEHARLIHALPLDGIAVFPANDAYTPLWRASAANRPIFDFALQNNPQSSGPSSPLSLPSVSSLPSMPAAIRGTLSSCASANPNELHIETPIGALDIVLPVLGHHNAHNALAAVAAALAAGISLAAIKRGLAAFEPVAGRLQIKQAAALCGATVIDDTYNANPDSMRAAIDVLATCRRPRMLVIGDMGEVGDHGIAFHREIGAYARQQLIDALFALGQATPEACSAYGIGALHFDSVQALISHLQTQVNTPEATILVKGSRFMRMERVVEALTSTIGFE